MLKKLNTPIGHWVLLLTLSSIWGSSFILIKRGLDVFSYEQVAALRIFIAFLFLSLIGRKFFTSFPKKKTLPLFLSGFIGNGIPAFIFAKSGTYLDSGLIGILNVLTPLFTLLIGLIFYKLKVKKYNYFGIALGIFGTIFLLFPDLKESNEKTTLYSIIAISGTICYGWSTNIIKWHLQHLSALQITTLAFSFIGPWAGIYLFTSDFLSIMNHNPFAWQSLGYVSILAILGSAFCVIVFNKLLHMTSTLFATSCTYLIPIVAILWGILDKESITKHHFIGFLIISCGIYLVNKRC